MVDVNVLVSKHRNWRTTDFPHSKKTKVFTLIFVTMVRNQIKIGATKSQWFSLKSLSRTGARIVVLYCSYLSSIHEKANCIAIFWTGRPHSLGSCHLRCVWTTCLTHKGGGVPLSALLKDTTSELAGFFSTTSPKCRASSRKAVDRFLKSFGMTRQGE